MGKKKPYSEMHYRVWRARLVTAGSDEEASAALSNMLDVVAAGSPVLLTQLDEICAERWPLPRRDAHLAPGLARRQRQWRPRVAVLASGALYLAAFGGLLSWAASINAGWGGTLSSSQQVIVALLAMLSMFFVVPVELALRASERRQNRSKRG